MAKLERPIHKAHPSHKAWDKPADRKTIDKALAALKANGISASFTETVSDAKKIVLSMIPKGSEVMTMSSETLRLSGIASEINESGRYKTPRSIFSAGKLSDSQKRKMGAGPDYALGSVHAVTEDGKVLIASATGSQLPAYAYGAGKVIWVVGAQKIVRNLDEAFARLEEYTFPLENERSKKVYGAGSFISKELIINKEFQEGRLSMIIVGEKVGF